MPCPLECPAHAVSLEAAQVEVGVVALRRNLLVLRVPHANALHLPDAVVVEGFELAVLLCCDSPRLASVERDRYHIEI